MQKVSVQLKDPHCSKELFARKGVEQNSCWICSEIYSMVLYKRRTIMYTRESDF
jgi:hypothetical protein